MREGDCVPESERRGWGWGGGSLARIWEAGPGRAEAVRAEGEEGNEGVVFWWEVLEIARFQLLFVLPWSESRPHPPTPSLLPGIFLPNETMRSGFLSACSLVSTMCFACVAGKGKGPACASIWGSWASFARRRFVGIRTRSAWGAALLTPRALGRRLASL